MSTQRIDPDRLSPELVEKAARDVPAHPIDPPRTVALCVAAFLSAVLDDKEAMDRAVVEIVNGSYDSWAEAFRAGVIEAVSP